METVYNDNLGRRLTTTQRADLAVELAEIWAEKAKLRRDQSDKLNRGVNGQFQAVPYNLEGTGDVKNPGRGSALEIAAKRANVSYGTAYKMSVIKAVNSHIYKEVQAGRKSINAAYKTVKADIKSKRMFNPQKPFVKIDSIKILATGVF